MWPKPTTANLKVVVISVLDQWQHDRCPGYKSREKPAFISSKSTAVKYAGTCIIRLPYQLNISPSTNRAGRPAHSSRWASLKGKGSEGKQHPLHSGRKHSSMSLRDTVEVAAMETSPTSAAHPGCTHPYRPTSKGPPDGIGYLFRKAAKMTPVLCPLLAHFWAMSPLLAHTPPSGPSQRAIEMPALRTAHRIPSMECPAISSAMTS